MTIAVTTLAASGGITGSIDLTDALRSGGPLWILMALALTPLFLLAMRKFRAAFIAPLIFVGYLKTVQSKGLSLIDPTMIALLLLCGSVLLDLLFASTGKDRDCQREFLTQWKGIAAFGVLVAVTGVSYLYSPAPTYGWDKLTRFLVISGILFFAPLVLIKKTEDIRHFTLAILVCATLLSIKLLYGINDASLFDASGHPLSSESRDVTQIGAGQLVAMGLLWLIFCPHCNLRRLALMISVPLLSAALIASVARGPILFFCAVVVLFMFSHHVRAAVTSTKVWLPVSLFGLLAFAGSLYWLQRQEAAQEKFRTKRAEIEEVLRGSSTPTYTAGRRLTLYGWALAMFAEKPLTGWGLGGWSYYVFDRDTPSYPHNLVLEIAAEEGVMGLAALGALLFTVFLAMRRIWRSSLDLSFIVPVFAFSFLATLTSGDINVNRPLWLWCGVIFALAGMAKRRLHRSQTLEWKGYLTNRFGLDRPPSGITPFTSDASGKLPQKIHHKFTAVENTSPTTFSSAILKAAPWSLSGSKRVFDFACATMLITAVAPLMAMLAIVVKASSAGPFLFRQNRSGRNGEEFQVLKFRTMYSSTGDSSGALITRSGDCRLTRVGRWLRKWKLDELPQLVNVLRGDMSLVGHRPDMLKYIQTLNGQDRNILYFLPGITSPASLRFRNEEQELDKVPPEEMEQFYISKLLPQKIRMDLDYAERATFLTDCRVLLRTALSLLWRHRG